MTNYTPTVDTLANEIRRVDGDHSLGAGALADALTPWLADHTRQAKVNILRYAADWIVLRDIARHGNNDPLADAEADASTWLTREDARDEHAITNWEIQHDLGDA